MSNYYLSIVTLDRYSLIEVDPKEQLHCPIFKENYRRRILNGEERIAIHAKYEAFFRSNLVSKNESTPRKHLLSLFTAFRDHGGLRYFGAKQQNIEDWKICCDMLCQRLFMHFFLGPKTLSIATALILDKHNMPVVGKLFYQRGYVASGMCVV